MPRKHWVMKNRYCWNATLDEEAFLRILKLYTRGRTASHSARVIARHASRFGARKVSRQAINRYHLLFGDYLYAMLPDSLKFAHQLPDDFDPDDPEYNADYFIKQSIMNLHHTLYEKVGYRDPVNDSLLTNKTQDMYKFIKRQSQARCGLTLETFANHFALSFWHLYIRAIDPLQPIGRALYEHLKATMEEYPLGSFEMLSIRLENKRA